MIKRIEIAGILGAGKTTLLQNIETVLNKDIYCIYEDLSPINDIWNLVKNDGTQNHYFLLISAYYLESTRKIINKINEKSKILITDYSLSVHHYVYAYYCWENGLINDVEWSSLSKIFDFYFNLMPPLEGIIEIDILPPKALYNLNLRSRDLDKDVSIDYLERLSGLLRVNKNYITRGLPTIKIKSEEIKTFSNNTQLQISNLLSNI